MMPLLAQSLGAQPDSTLSYLIVGIVVVALSSIVQLGLATKQLFGGNKGERQIEPTQLAAITQELSSQTRTLNKLDREMGETRAGINAGIKALDEKVTEQGKQIDNAFRRINAISVESAAVQARVDGLENREGLSHA